MSAEEVEVTFRKIDEPLMLKEFNSYIRFAVALIIAGAVIVLSWLYPMSYIDLAFVFAMFLVGILLGIDLVKEEE